MKRSEINLYIQQAIDHFKENKFYLPPFAYWTQDEWSQKNEEYQELRDNMLGWDLTDFGSGDFLQQGLLLFTIRNGNLHNPQYPKPYAEKIMLVRENQITPYHFHWSKMEDIINRGGGKLVIRLYNSDPEDRMDMDSDVTAYVDGRRIVLKAGGTIELEPGESMTMMQRQYHSFWGKPGEGIVMVGEVSRVNDDQADNRFAETNGRFPTIEEDAPKTHLLCTDYQRL